MENQIDLEGNKTEVKKELIKKTTTKYTADVFSVSVSEAGKDQLDKLHEEADTSGIRRWVAKNMKLRDPKPLINGSEGEAFQADLDKLVNAL